jgi:hypothetical protein
MAMAAALRSGGPARIGGEPLRSGPFGAIARQRGLRAAIAVPIVVEGCYWGVTVAATEQSDFPPGIESRMADFMELAAIAIANTQADEQGASWPIPRRPYDVWPCWWHAVSRPRRCSRP